MEKAPDGPPSPESIRNIQSEMFPVEMAVTKIYNNIYSSDDLLVGTSTDFIRHRGWKLLNVNRELPTFIAQMSSSPVPPWTRSLVNRMESAGDFVLGVQGSPAIVMLRCLHLSKCLETEPTQTQLWSARVSKFTDRLKTEVHRGGGSNVGLEV